MCNTFAVWRSALAPHWLWRRGCLSVCLSRWCIVTIMQPSPDCSPALLVFPIPNMNPISSRGVRSSNGRGVGKPANKSQSFTRGQLLIAQHGTSACTSDRRFVGDSWASCFIYLHTYVWQTQWFVCDRVILNRLCHAFTLLLKICSLVPWWSHYR